MIQTVKVWFSDAMRIYATSGLSSDALVHRLLQVVGRTQCARHLSRSWSREALSRQAMTRSALQRKTAPTKTKETSVQQSFKWTTEKINSEGPRRALS